MGCPLTSSIKPKEFHKSVITPAELLIALEGYEENWFDSETVYYDELIANYKGLLECVPADPSKLSLL